MNSLASLFLLTFLASSLSGASPADQAIAAWQSRDKPGQTETAILIWKEMLKTEPGNADLYLRLAKAMGRAVRHAKDSKEKRRWAEEALASAQKAVELAPKHADAYATYAEALGQWTDSHKGMNSLRNVKKAVLALNKAIELKPEHAYAHMLLAEFYRQSPAVISVGDLDKALEQARLAVQYGPTYAINHLVLAKALIDLKKKEEAIVELKAVLALTPPADAIPETKSDQATAKSMLDMLVSDSSSPLCDETHACTEKQ